MRNPNTSYEMNSSFYSNSDAQGARGRFTSNQASNSDREKSEKTVRGILNYHFSKILDLQVPIRRRYRNDRQEQSQNQIFNPPSTYERSRPMMMKNDSSIPNST
jgi:hypothetical protein